MAGRLAVMAVSEAGWRRDTRRADCAGRARTSPPRCGEALTGAAGNAILKKRSMRRIEELTSACLLDHAIAHG